MFRAALLGVALLACKREIKWEAQKIKTVEIGPFSAPMPAGWRDLRELVDKSKIPQLQATMVMPEVAETDLGFQANVISMWGTPAEIFGAPVATCKDAADLTLKQQKAKPTGTPVESTVDGEPLCTFTSELNDATGTYRARTHGDHVLFVQCLRATKGDPLGDAGCSAIWSNLKLKP